MCVIVLQQVNKKDPGLFTTENTVNRTFARAVIHKKDYSEDMKQESYVTTSHSYGSNIEEVLVDGPPHVDGVIEDEGDSNGEYLFSSALDDPGQRHSDNEATIIEIDIQSETIPQHTAKTTNQLNGKFPDTQLYDESADDDHINSEYFEDREGTSTDRTETKLNRIAKADKEIVALQKDLMIREFELLHERHCLQMAIMKNEMEYKRIEHKKRVEYLDRKLNEN